MPRMLYTLSLWLLLPFAVLRLFGRAMRQPEYLQHLGERFGVLRGSVPDKAVIWLHCVSVGETRAAAPLIALLRARYPDHAILVTHTTPTGRATSKQLFGDGVLRCYLPYDLPYAVRRFLQHYKPKVGVLLETELWFNLIAFCRGRDIPLLLANARMSAKSARGYARLGRIVEDGLKQLAVIAAQTRADAERLCELGAPEVVVTGNLKFDVVVPQDAVQRGAALRQSLGIDRPVLLAASTRDGEEALVLDAVAQAKIPGLLTVIVPRHPERFDTVAALLERRGLVYVRRSSLQQGAKVPGQVSVVLGDSMGEMPTYYSSCDLAFIGGTLLPFGGQNPIEASMLGCPVVVGPHTFNFEEVVSEAVMRGAAARVWDVGGLAAELRELMGDAKARQRMGEAGKAYVAANRGAARRTLDLIGKFI
ncbi:MAG: lipid IV(A) 3-deoxy-D-manno-octulosonic acid transferase [Methylophilaceae bacterium]|nr:lipid IV(A) 3-deoxy-D-manno-octulosonic acid transferase [Methylophilaceae bacterium]